MGLEWFHVTMEWFRERNYDEPTTVAITTTTWQYRHTVIKWYVPACEDNDDDFLENIVVHELVHVLIAPLVNVNNEKELPLQHEYATECLSRALLWVREAGQNDPKK